MSLASFVWHFSLFTFCVFRFAMDAAEPGSRVSPPAGAATERCLTSRPLVHSVWRQVS